MKVLVFIGLLSLALAPATAWAQATGTVNTPPGSVWTYLGPTFGADWASSLMVGPTSSTIGEIAAFNSTTGSIIVGGNALPEVYTTSALMIGAAHLGFTSSGSWLEQRIPNTTSVSQMSSLWRATASNTGIGGYGVLGGGRTSDATTIGANIFGVGGFAVGNAASATGRLAWAGYFEAQRDVGAGIVHGIESDMINLGSEVLNGPYNMFPPGISPNLWLSCGKPGAGTQNNCTAAIGILNNTKPYKQGIVFHATALEGNDGVTGTATAIMMPKGDAIVWAEPTGVNVARIQSNTAATGSPGSALVFVANSMYYGSYDGTGIGFRADVPPASVNYPIAFGQTVGNSPGITTNAGNLLLDSQGGAIVLARMPVTPGYTVAGLPGGLSGARVHVTDQLTSCPAVGAALTGGGAVVCPAFFNGSAWVGG